MYIGSKYLLKCPSKRIISLSASNKWQKEERDENNCDQRIAANITDQCDELYRNYVHSFRINQHTCVTSIWHLFIFFTRHRIWYSLFVQKDNKSKSNKKCLPRCYTFVLWLCVCYIRGTWLHEKIQFIRILIQPPKIHCSFRLIT